MSQLPVYSNLDEKQNSFKTDYDYRINSAKQFDLWYKQTKNRQQFNLNNSFNNQDKDFEVNEYNYLPYVFRGVGDAKYKILASAQRLWIVNNMQEWAGKNYLEFIQDLLLKAGKLPLLDKVFKFYKLTPRQRDFPLMSILQHYGAPTPLIDWTYNIDVSLYFATEYCTPVTSKNEIDQYFSVYLIDRQNENSKDFRNLLEYNQGSFPLLKSFFNVENDDPTLYLSDFENRFTKRSSKGFQDQRPLTIIFNQRIIPQEGLFVFNPSPDKPLEDSFNRNRWSSKMICINIHKDLSDYIRRKIKLTDIDKGFIYPDLEQDAKHIRESVLYDLVKG